MTSSMRASLAHPDVQVTRRTPELIAKAHSCLPEAVCVDRTDESVIARYLIVETVANQWNVPDFLPTCDAEGRPLWEENIFWSLSHKEDWIAVAVSDHPVGIDVEVLVPRNPSLFSLFSESEWRVLGEKTWSNFYCLWTAKEALIKQERATIDLLPAITLLSRDASALTMEYNGHLSRLRSEESDNCIYSFTL